MRAVRLYTKYKKLKPKRKKSSGGGSVFAWMLVIGGLCLLGWIWWQYQETPKVSQTPPPQPPPPQEENKKTNLVVRTNPVVIKTNLTVAAPSIEPSRTNTNTLTLPVAVVPVPVPEPVSVVPIIPIPPGTRNPRTILEAQIALARQGISSGSIDGVIGSQTRAAIRAFQLRENIPITGELDERTKQRLFLDEPLKTNYTVSGTDLLRLSTNGTTWLAKSEQERLDYENIVELLAEKSRAHPNLIRSFNPSLDWTNMAPGTAVTLPVVDYPGVRAKAAFVRIKLAEKILQAFDSGTNLLVHFPCSIASKVDKRPVGRLFVEKIALMPNYRFDPTIFSESAEARAIGRPLMIPPGPNNPVGTAWIGLSRPGYGIHGTPRPEDVGRTESHGCFRLANWNAEYLAKLVSIGMPVYVEP